jgi:hypothetical protein
MDCFDTRVEKGRSSSDQHWRVLMSCRDGIISRAANVSVRGAVALLGYRFVVDRHADASPRWVSLSPVDAMLLAIEP